VRRQVDSGSADHWTGRVDFRHVELPLVIEVQSERYHSALVDRSADVARIRGLRAAGFIVVEIWDTEVWSTPWTVVQKVRAAMDRCRR
jgi:very-short-patch-repair endonuclease